MSTTSGSRDYGRFDALAEEFVERFRRGERPSLQEYVDRLPELADEIREMFPALVEVERVEIDGGAAQQPPPPAVARLRELGDYRILGEVGRGGMGVVYEAEQISLGRRVALKVLPAHAVGDRTAMARFRREAKAAARLHHTNIVPVFEVGQDGDLAFYAMQLIQGQGLDQVIDELRRLVDPNREAPAPGPDETDAQAPTAAAAVALGRSAPAPRPRDRAVASMAGLLLTGRLAGEGPGTPGTEAMAANGLEVTEAFDAQGSPIGRVGPAGAEGPPVSDSSGSAVLPGGKRPSETDSTGGRQPFLRSVAQIGRQAAQGLAHAHSRGIVHRDIKPSNLLLDTAGVVWITDFGLAKSEDDGLTATGDILGTLRYMAPERFRGQGDARADLYALGMTLYELLTLRPAYSSPDRLKLIEQIQGQEPPRPRSIDARIPRDLETIVLKAMDRAPEGRYATADAMAEDLRRFLADEPILARQVGTTERYWRWARRNPVVATLGGLLTAILVMVTVGSTLMAARFADLAEREGNSATAERAARLDSDRLAEAESRARFEAEAARKAESEAKRGAVSALADAIDQTYVATRNEVRAMRLAHEPGWRSGALERLRGLTRLGSRNLDREALRSDAIACLAEIDLKVESNFRPGNLGAWRVQFSPDGQVLAVSDTHKSQIYLRNLANRQVLPAVPKPLGGSPFAFHPGGALTQPSERGRVVSLALAPGQPTFPPIEGQGHAVNLAFSRSGERLAIAWGQVDERLAGIPVNLERVTVHATATGALLRTITLPIGIEVHWKVALALSPDGRSVAVTGTGRDVRIYPVESEAPPAILGTLDAPIAALAFHPDGQSLAACGKRFAIIWDLESRSERTRLHAADRGFWDLAFSPDGRFLATTSDDAMGRLWDSRSGRELAAAPAGVGAGLSVAFSPRGDRFAVGGGSASVLTIEGGHERLTDTTQTYNTNSLVFDPAEPRIFYSGESGTIHAWRPGENEVRLIQPPWVDLNLSALKLGPGGRDFVLGYGRNMRTGPGADYSLQVRSRVDILAARSLKGPQTSVTWVDLDPAGLHVAAASVDSKLHVWDFRTGTLRFQTTMADTVRALRLLDDARLLVATTNRLLLLSIPDGAVLRELEIAGDVGALVLTPDGAEAIVGTTEGALHRVQLASLTITQSRIAHDAGGRLKLAISSDGSLLAVPTQGHRLVALLDARTLEPRAHLPGLEAGSVAFLEFDPKGRYLAFGDAHVRLWDLGLIEEELATVELAMGLPTTRLPSSVESVAVPGSLDPADLERSTGLLRAGVIAVQEGRFADGVVILQEASDRLESLRRAGPEGAMVARRQGECDGFLAGALRELGRRGEALASSRRSLAAYESLSDPDPRDLYNTACGLAMISGLNDRAGPSDRERLQVQSVAALRRAIAADGPRIAALLAGDHDLDPLRARSDFQGLVADTTFPRYPFAQTFPVDVVGSLAPSERAELSELSEQVERHLESSWAWRARGDFFARRGAWAPARADFRRALELNPPGGWREADFDNIFALDSAVVLIESGDHEGHRRLAQAMLDRFAGSKDPAVADTTAKVNLLTAPPAEDLGRALRFAQRAVDEGEGSGIFSWCLLARGMAAYRTGEFAATLDWLEKAGRSNLGPDHASACKSYSAMAEHRLGHAERSEVLLVEAGKLVADRAAQKDVGAGWHNLRIAAMAHREAQALIHPAPSPVNGPARSSPESDRSGEPDPHR